ncbi:MAG: hypothetical protein QOC82_2966 [Frankiaceae bacterium]|nr:hypothetical protein [Frankiaceae bacterium]
MAITGRVGLLALLATVLVWIAPDGGRTVGWVAAALAAGIIVDLVLAASPRRLTLQRATELTTRLGETVESVIVVHNRSGRRARGRLRDGWPPSANARPRAAVLDIRPFERQRVTLRLTPERRGETESRKVTLQLVGPLGLAARQRSREHPAQVRVLPAFTSRRLLPEKLNRLRQLDGEVVAPVRGQGSEFDSLREYVVGDDPRSIDWRATARRSDVVVRTWRPERDRHVVLLLDTGRTSAARVAGAPRLETALDAALLMTALARHAGDRVTLLAHDVRLRAAVDAGRGASALATVVAATVGLQPALVETDMPAVVTQVLRRVRRRALVVLLTAMDPAPVSEGLLPAIPSLVRRHAVLVASIADPAVETMAAGRGDAEAVYAAAAAEATRTERADVAAALRRRGVDVLEAPPATFASKLADAYLDLKASGRL